MRRIRALKMTLFLIYDYDSFLYNKEKTVNKVTTTDNIKYEASRIRNLVIIKG